jgi:hypothetical protein
VGEHTSMSKLYEVLATRVVLPLLLGISAWTFTQLWTHEGRLTVLEVRSESIRDDVREIKSDVKKLLVSK